MLPSSDRPPASSLVLNAASIAGSELVSRVAATVSFVILARFFAPDVYGQLAFAASMSAMAGPVVDLGMTTVAGARISRDPGSVGRILGQVWRVRVLFAGLSIATIAAVGAWYEGGTLLLLSLGYAIGLVPAAFATTWVAYQCGIPRLFLYEKLIQSGLFVALVAAAVLVGPEPLLIALAASFSSFIAVGLSIPWVLRACQIEVSWVGEGTRQLVAEARPIFLTLLPAAILLPATSLAVGWLEGTKELGLFWLAGRLLVLGPIAGNFAVSILIPLLAAHPSDALRRRDALASLFSHTLLVILCGAWITAFGADELVVLLFGPMHVGAASLVAWTGTIIGAEALSIILTRLAPYFGTSGALSRVMMIALMFGVITCAALWSSLGVAAFMSGVLALHIAVLVGSLLAYPVDVRSRLLRPSGWVVASLGSLVAVEVSLFASAVSGGTALAIRLIVSAAIVLCAAVALNRRWKAPERVVA